MPDAWQGTELRTGRTAQALTIAPWYEKATVTWQGRERKLLARDVDVSIPQRDSDRELYDLDADPIELNPVEDERRASRLGARVTHHLHYYLADIDRTAGRQHLLQEPTAPHGRTAL